MKTTVEIPDTIFREAKALAASRGLSLRTLLTEALREKLANVRRSPRAGWPVAPPRVARAEIERVQATIDGEFSRVDSETWR